jgi:MoxR-like ATPase
MILKATVMNDQAPMNATNEGELIAFAENVAQHLTTAREAIGMVVFGQHEAIENSLITVLSGGHALLVGVPGLAKTRLVETLGIVLGLDSRRIQFTPDLMPSDIIGSEVLDASSTGQRQFRFIKGPIFTSLLMADEINRASPRTQSALLQAMQEYHVTVAGDRYDLPRPFHVLATENPIEQEGTYPLPEAQLDRFLMQVDMTYPDEATERRILVETTASNEAQAKPVLSAKELISAQHLVRRMPIGDSVVDAIVKLTRAARPGGDAQEIAHHLAWGAGPRAGQALMLAVRARALIQGRFAPSIDDVAALAAPVLKHRLALNFKARAEGITIDGLISQLLAIAL